MKQKPWLKYLTAVRAIDSRGDPITSLALLEELDIQPTELSLAMEIAAGWISNLRRWGYIKRKTGVKVKGPQRSLQVYTLTDWGKMFRVKGSAKAALRMVANPPQTRGKTEK